MKILTVPNAVVAATGVGTVFVLGQVLSTSSKWVQAAALFGALLVAVPVVSHYGPK